MTDGQHQAEKDLAMRTHRRLNALAKLLRLDGTGDQILDAAIAEIERLHAEVAAHKAVRVPNAKTIEIKDGDMFELGNIKLWQCTGYQERWIETDHISPWSTRQAPYPPISTDEAISILRGWGYTIKDLRTKPTPPVPTIDVQAKQTNMTRESVVGLELQCEEPAPARVPSVNGMKITHAVVDNRYGLVVMSGSEQKCVAYAFAREDLSVHSIER